MIELRNATIEIEEIMIGRKHPPARRGRQEFCRDGLKNP